MANDSPHSGHRARMKARFLENGFRGFEDHEILEFLLFYAVARRDTNELGHALLGRFGSLHRVLDAPISELTKVEGIGEHTAVLLKTLPEICRRYRQSKLENQKSMETLDDIGNFLIEHYMPLDFEQVTILLLDNRQQLISFEILQNGSVNSSDINVRKIVEIALMKNAASVVLAHNHPSGNLVPSDSDITTTKMIMNALRPIDLRLREHVLVAVDSYLPIVRHIAENARFEPRYIAVRAEDDEQEWAFDFEKE